MRQNFILIHLFFFYFICLSDDVLCKIAIWADNIALNSSCDKPSDLWQQVELNCNLILINQNFWKKFLFFTSFFFILKCQDLVIKVIHSNSNIKSCYPELFWKSCFKDLKFLKDNFTINVLWNQTFPSLFIAISSSFVYKEIMHTLRNLKN